MDATDQFGVFGSQDLLFVRRLAAIGLHLLDLLIVKLLCTFPVFLGFCQNLLFGMEFKIFVMAQIIVPEQLADSKANLGLRPVMQVVLLDLLE